MNRKYVAGGVILLAGIAGFMGVRFFENQTAQAVREALAGASVQTAEVRYSLLNNTLFLKGLEYELTDKDGTRKGSVESVEVKGFNRGCLAAGADAAAYDAVSLPLVAESVVITGVSDRQEGAGMQVEQKLASLQLRGWHQRLGVVLEQYRLHRNEASCYEELYRYRLDGMDADRLTLSLTEKDVLSMAFDVDAARLVEGVRAPQGGEKVSPMSLTLDGIRFTGTDFSDISVSGELKSVTVRDLLLPEPAVMVELIAVNRAMDAADLDTEEGMDAFDAQYVKMMELLQKNYEKKPPLSGFSMKETGLRVTTAEKSPAAQDKEPLVTVAMNSLDYALALVGAGDYKTAVELDGLSLDMPELRSDAILKRYAPEGFVLNAEGESVTGEEKMSGHVRYELKGLGELSLELALSGDMGALERLSVDSTAVDPFAVMQSVNLERLNMNYEDSGLLPMALELVAREEGQTPEALLSMLFQNLSVIGQFPNRAAQQLGSALAEQLTMPGEFGMALVPAKPMTLLTLFSMIMEASDELPVSFSSVPGQKPLTDYLPKN